MSEIEDTQQIISLLTASSEINTKQYKATFLENAWKMHIYFTTKGGCSNMIKLLNDMFQANVDVAKKSWIQMYNESLLLTNSVLPLVKKYTNSLTVFKDDLSNKFTQKKSFGLSYTPEDFKVKNCDISKIKYYNLETALSSNLFCEDKSFIENFKRDDKSPHQSVWTSECFKDIILLKAQCQDKIFTYTKLENAENIFSNYTGGLSDKIKELDNAMIAGGSIFISLFLENSFKPFGTDIDIFVWGETLESRLETINKIINYVHDDDAMITMWCNVITIFRRDSNLSIQIIDCGDKTAERIIGEFDMSICQIFYKKGEFKMSRNFIQSINTKCSMLSKCKPFRIAKYMQRGLSFITTGKEKIFNSNLFVEDYKWDELFGDPSIIKYLNRHLLLKTDSPKEFVTFAKNIYNKNTRLVTYPLNIEDFQQSFGNYLDLKTEESYADGYFDERCHNFTIATSCDDFESKFFKFRACQQKNTNTFHDENGNIIFIRVKSLQGKILKRGEYKYLCKPIVVDVKCSDLSLFESTLPKIFETAKKYSRRNEIFKKQFSDMQQRPHEFNLEAGTLKITDKKFSHVKNSKLLDLEDAILLPYIFGTKVYFKICEGTPSVI